MNFLSHHQVALRAARADAPPELFLGNVLPDLLQHSGEGRLRDAHLPPHAGDDTPLLAGIRLHLAADRAFHGSDAFKRLDAAAGAHLRAQPFSEPLRRVFFLSHVFAELALDAYLLEPGPDIAEDFYNRLETADLPAAVRATSLLLGRAGEAELVPGLAPHVRRFTAARYLYDYARPEGLAAAMRRVGGRAGVANFETEADRRVLAAAFVSFRPAVRDAAGAVLQPPPGLAGPWYNVGGTPPPSGADDEHSPGRDVDADGDA